MRAVVPISRATVAVNAALHPVPDPDDNQARSDALVESYRRLAGVFHDVLSEQSPEALLERIADTLGELVPHNDLNIYEADEKRRELLPVFAGGTWAEEVLSNAIPYGQGITGWAVVHRSPVLANEAHNDPRVSFVPGTPPDPEALITVPLIARGALKGALNIYRIGEDALFDEDEFELARWFGDAAALALDNAQIRARLEHLAHTDSLTGLYNHRYFHERLRSELQRAGRAHDTVALMMLDIDDFKRVNDVCGHARGRPGARARRRRPALDRARRPTRSAGSAARSSRSSSPPAPSGDALGLGARLREALAPEPGRVRGRDHALGRRRARARARDERARADRVRRVGDDDGEGAREGPHRRLRGRGRGAPGRRETARATSARSPT